jgi:hypothetical protein
MSVIADTYPADAAANAQNPPRQWRRRVPLQHSGGISAGSSVPGVRAFKPTFRRHAG